MAWLAAARVLVSDFPSISACRIAASQLAVSKNSRPHFSGCVYTVEASRVEEIKSDIATHCVSIFPAEPPSPTATVPR